VSTAVKRLIASATILLLVILSFPESAVTAKSTPPPLVGEIRRVKIGPEMTLMELAVQEGVGFQALQNANPASDPWRPDPGRPILVPAQAIFPGPPTAGLTINLAELRVYFFAERKGSVGFYPLGIGRQGWETPEGVFQVIQKVENPVWRVPPAIKRENPELPDFMPAGPQNPLGNYWLGLSVPGYGLHGTNRPYGVGRRVSHGCIRLYDEDIKELFDKVRPGTRVRILYQPVKATIAGGDLYLEVHPDFDQRYPNLFQEALSRISALPWPGDIDYSRVRTLVSEQRGIPARIGSLQAQTGT